MPRRSTGRIAIVRGARREEADPGFGSLGDAQADDDVAGGASLRNPCRGALPRALAQHDLVLGAFDGIDANRLVDVHAHREVALRGGPHHLLDLAMELGLDFLEPAPHHKDTSVLGYWYRRYSGQAFDEGWSIFDAEFQLDTIRLAAAAVGVETPS